MKLHFIAFISLFCFQWTIAQNPNKEKSKDFNTFINLFSEIDLPYNTKALNSIGYSIVEKKFKEIPLKLALKYLCNGNDNEMQFQFKIYSMEDGTLIKEGFEKYKYCAVFKIKFENFYLIAYPKIDTLLQYHLASIDFQGKIIDNITINETKGETEYIYYKATIIDRNLNINTFEYEANTAFLKVQTTVGEMPPRTFITTSIYRINELTGKFELKDKKTKNSTFSVDDFASSIKDSIVDDPMYLR